MAPSGTHRGSKHSASRLPNSSRIAKAASSEASAIELRPPAPGATGEHERCRQLLQILTENPQLATAIKELRIVTALVDYARRNLGGGRGWIADSARRTLPVILERLVALKQISIVQVGPYSPREPGLSWGDLPHLLRQQLTSIFASPSLESAQLKGFTFSSPQQLMSLFTQAESLRSLSLSRGHFTNATDAGAWPLSQPWRPQLTSLTLSEVDGQGYCHVFLDQRVDLSRVVSLRIASKLDMFSLASILQDIPLLPWSHLVSLRVLVLDLAPGLVHLFNSLPVDTSLRQLAIEFPAGGFRVGGVYTVEGVNASLEAGLVRARHLKAVEMIAFGEDSGEGRFPLWAEDMGWLLSPLERHGIL
ncbi:hypothetical protein FB45DRAFT_1064533 [Roridomyces roridus]|uniref:Uncharacterized protein n=1 Tax=Roridomyces roridus TaxID=1738132 RepID=A0AAD7FE61_9AGAR|nr:hypothetical protein FB45DRAFT_1064533 [Roridomyces roridus]